LADRIVSHDGDVTLVCTRMGRVYRTIRCDLIYRASADEKFVQAWVKGQANATVSLRLLDFAKLPHLIQIARSHLVDASLIQSVHRDHVMVNNMRVPLSRRFRPAVNRLWLSAPDHEKVARMKLEALVQTMGVDWVRRALE